MSEQTLLGIAACIVAALLLVYAFNMKRLGSRKMTVFDQWAEASLCVFIAFAYLLTGLALLFHWI
jgi:hypothetical protein